MEDQEAPNGRPDLSAGEQPDTEIRPGREFKQWKMKRGLYDDEDDENANPLGDRFSRICFRRRYEALFSDQVGRKYERNRAKHVTHQAFSRQFDLLESGLIESGNARALNQPQHQDREGNVVTGRKGVWLPGYS